MATDQKLTSQEVFDIADSLQAAAAAVLAKRRSSADISNKDFDTLVEQETALRFDADRHRAVGITLLANEGNIDAKGLVTAIDGATKAINKVKKLRDVLGILASLVSLGSTLATGNVTAIVKQVAAVKDLVAASKK